MKKIFVILLLVYGCVGGYAQITDKMQLRDFNRAALDSYPQRVISFQQTDSICHVTIQEFVSDGRYFSSQSSEVGCC